MGRPINYHSYVSGVAGPEVAVMFAEEGVNGVHQDPQYNVIYPKGPACWSSAGLRQTQFLRRGRYWSRSCKIQGIGGVPITRKQVRAQRKALDLIEDEVGRPINYHSYVSGVAGPEVAVMFAEEGVNGVRWRRTPR